MKGDCLAYHCLSRMGIVLILVFINKPRHEENGTSGLYKKKHLHNLAKPPNIIFCPLNPADYITKTRLFKYIENFTSKN